MNLENYIETKIRERNLTIDYISEFDELYSSVENNKIRILFSNMHVEYIKLFSLMNQRLPTKNITAYFWADSSRDLINLIKLTLEMIEIFKKTPFAFTVEEKYYNIILKCNEFLKQYNGSTIPEHMEQIELYYTIPIFIPDKTVTMDNSINKSTAPLRLIDEGSYAHVFKFKDDFYQNFFALKRAKKDLNEKELLRFKREFEQMKDLSSPYIIEVYSYCEDKNQYIMEKMDGTLEKYIDTNNSKLDIYKRQGVILQILKGYQYLHAKGLFHRDVSFKNVLYKQYDDVVVFKISDFGLVKINNNDLTSENTDLKGCLNDPTLKTKGFTNYDLLDEIYALTLLLCYILTGKTKFSSIKNPHIKMFMEKGTTTDRTKRYQNLSDLKKGVLNCISNMQER